MSGAHAPAFGATLGVEEEFLTVHPATWAPVPAVADIIAAIPPSAVAAELKPELLAAQVEAATPVCGSLAEVRVQLAQARSSLAIAAAARGLAVTSAGFAFVTPDDAPLALAAGERYRQIGELYAGVIPDYAACGCHVHVGVPDRETAVAVVNHLRPWLPTLLALSGNSPFARGRDTGYASWRAVTQGRFPGFGVPPWCADVAAYDRALERQAEFGTTADARMTFWCARPSEHAPTVEVRAADALATVDETVLQAGLTRALVVRARADLTAGREAPKLDPPVCEAALWSAARYGLGGPGVHPVRERRVPARQLLQELLDHTDDALDELGDRVEVRRLVGKVLASGTGAERQRAAAVSRGMRAAAELVLLRPDPSDSDGWLPRETTWQARNPLDAGPARVSSARRP
ncbi:MAG TPA: glutamate--cysteine ligase [Yinghuangia sp.]|nr:glutamate--cysteine ligase [Yinghuangia sp.]